MLEMRGDVFTKDQDVIDIGYCKGVKRPDDLIHDVLKF